MANFNSSYWYHLYVNQNEKVALAATNLYKNNNSIGATFFSAYNASNSTQRWQWYGINSTSYILRCEEGGPNAFLSTNYERKETTPGQTQALMMRNNLTDDSIYWTVTPWGDGTFFLTNLENGTNWHLNKKGNGLLALSSNITMPQNGQRWSFKAIERINDDKFSAIDIPSVTISSNPTGVITPPSDLTQESDSLSMSAKAGISAGIGGFAILGFVILALFLYRRHKHLTQELYDVEQEHKEQRHPLASEIGGAQMHELGDASQHTQLSHQGNNTVKYGQDANVAYEMPATVTQQMLSPVELPSEANVGVR